MAQSERMIVVKETEEMDSKRNRRNGHFVTKQ